MNILVLTHSISTTGGGIAVFVENLCAVLGRKHNVHVLLPYAKHKTPLIESYRNDLYAIHKVKTSGLLSSLRVACKTIILRMKHDIDVAFIGHTMSTHSLGALILSKLFKIPYSILVHGTTLTYYLKEIKGLDGLFVDLVLKNASLILANSNYTKNIIKASGYGQLENKIKLLYPGVDTKAFHQEFDPDRIKKRYNICDNKIILTVGKMVKRKNHEKVIKALEKVIDKIHNITYLIVGSGPEGKNLHDMVLRHGLKKYVTFAGEVEEGELPYYYAACDIFVMPSLIIDNKRSIDFEGFGIVFSEANACGKPVIGGRAGGMYDSIIDGVTGLLVDPENVKAIADAIIRLLTDTEYARKLGKNGRRRVEQELSWERVGARFEGLLQRVIENCF
ncbi:MAG: glycosyltransferase family 4 protein [Thermodesulfobacteriota bacterium]